MDWPLCSFSLVLVYPSNHKVFMFSLSGFWRLDGLMLKRKQMGTERLVLSRGWARLRGAWLMSWVGNSLLSSRAPGGRLTLVRRTDVGRESSVGFWSPCEHRV